MFWLRRLLWMIPSLLGISLVTFALIDLAPADRALLELAGVESAASAQARAQALHDMRVRFGQIDPASGVEFSFGERYARWLQHAIRLDFAAASDDPADFTQRITTALPVTLLLAFVAVVAAVVVSVPLGTWLGLGRGRRLQRFVSTLLLLLWSVPEFLLGTLLVLFLAGGLAPALLPGAGLRSPGSETWALPAQMLDLAAHLILPVATLALGPSVWLTRQLRESMARAATSDFVVALRGFGVDERTVRRRIVRNGLVPLATAVGTLLPMLVSGSVVVERIFGLPGLGDLACRAVHAREVPMVMAMTMLVAVVTLIGLVVSDLLHRALDPRVAWGRR
ncbi:MAG: ABC transporter permease [Planctomycetota bacterium]